MDIEKYGSGYIRIREEIAGYPTMQFEYEEMGNGYLVTLSYTEQKTTQKTTKECILDYLSVDKSMTREDLAIKIGVSSDTIKKHLADLQAQEKLQRIGGRKSGEWKVLKSIK